MKHIPEEKNEERTQKSHYPLQNLFYKLYTPRLLTKPINLKKLNRVTQKLSIDNSRSLKEVKITSCDTNKLIRVEINKQETKNTKIT